MRRFYAWREARGAEGGGRGAALVAALCITGITPHMPQDSEERDAANSTTASRDASRVPR